MDLIINHPDQLESAEVISKNLLTNSPAYSNWLFHTQKHQEQVLKDSEKFESRPYQSEYAALYCLRAKNICAGEMGIGKTLIVGYMISAIYQNLKDRRPGTIQIICPTLSSAFTRWLADLSSIEILKGKIEVVQDEGEVLKSQAPIWLYHQDFLKRKSKLCPKKSRAWYSRLLVLKNRRPSLLIVDEIHNYREGTCRTAHLKYLRDKSKRFLGISGSLSDGETELLSHLCRLVYKKDWPYNISEFTRAFGIKKKVNSHYIAGELEPGQEISGGRYLQQLPVHKVPEYYEVFRRFIHRPTLSDPNVRSCCTYPEYTSNLIKVTPTEEQVLRYHNLVGENEDEYRRLIQYGGFKERGEALSLIWPLIYLSSCPWMFGLEGNKFEHLNTILESAALKDEKVVIFTGLNEVGHQLHTVLKNQYDASQVVRLYAHDDKETPKSLSSDQRVEIFDRLQFDPKTKYGILSINLSAESIDLTSVHYAVFWDIPWDPIKAYQAIRRLIRPGSVAEHINLYYLVNERMVDEHLYRLLEYKLQNLSRLMDLDYDSEVELQTSSINPFSVLERVLGALN